MTQEEKQPINSESEIKEWTWKLTEILRSFVQIPFEPRLVIGYDSDAEVFSLYMAPRYKADGQLNIAENRDDFFSLNFKKKKYYFTIGVHSPGTRDEPPTFDYSESKVYRSVYTMLEAYLTERLLGRFSTTFHEVDIEWGQKHIEETNATRTNNA